MSGAAAIRMLASIGNSAALARWNSIRVTPYDQQRRMAERLAKPRWRAWMLDAAGGIIVDIAVLAGSQQGRPGCAWYRPSNEMPLMPQYRR